MCPWLGNGHTGDKRKQAATRQDEACFPWAKLPLFFKGNRGGKSTQWVGRETFLL